MNIVPTFPRPQLELLHKQRTGFFGEDCTPTEEFKKKYSDWPIKDVTNFVKSIYNE